MPGSALTRFAWLSIAAAMATIGLKATAYILTGSVGLLSDALESLVNLVAAVGIGWTAWPRLLHPQPIEQAGLGLGISIGASLINLGVARILLQAGRCFRSITLEADAHHLMTDVWTSAGVLLGIGAVVFTGWEHLDPIIALVVAVNIVWTGVQLVRRSALGLAVRLILERYQQDGVQSHALRTRQAGARRFVSVHILVPGEWTVQRGHWLLEQVERDIRQAVPNVTVFTG